MSWEFETYSEKSTEQDSGSEKFFRGQERLDAIVRESVQNSLDAVENGPVRMVFKQKDVLKEHCNCLKLEELCMRLQECGKSEPMARSSNKIRFMVIEDFNTKGLEKEDLKKFFYSDNITGKKQGGGSHGIGKAVYPICSEVQTFFGYAISDDYSNGIFQGRSILKSHHFKGNHYRPYGNLEIKEEGNNFIDNIFSRTRGQKGLSLAIPYSNIQNDKKLIEQAILRQCYVPILFKKLEVVVEEEIIDSYSIIKKSKHLKFIKKCMDTPMIESKIKKTDWSTQKGLKDSHDLTKKVKARLGENAEDSLRITLEMVTPNGEKGNVLIFINRSNAQGEQKKEKVHFWREEILVSKAGYNRLPSGYSVVVMAKKNDGLSDLLRSLEDPGHVQWETGTIHPEVVNKYGRKTEIEKFVKYLKRLPYELVKHIQSKPQELDKNFLAKYFPRPVSKRQEKSEKDGKGGGGTEKLDFSALNPVFPDFNYASQGKGFSLTLKNKKNFPPKVTIQMAYGTNAGNAFKHYEKEDFCLDDNIKAKVSGAKVLMKKDNLFECCILDSGFKVSFEGFDSERELKIRVDV